MSGRSARYNIIYTRIIVGDVISALTKMARQGDPGLKPLADALSKMQTVAGVGFSGALGINRLATSTSTLGTLAGAFSLFGAIMMVETLIAPALDPIFEARMARFRAGQSKVTDRFMGWNRVYRQYTPAELLEARADLEGESGYRMKVVGATPR